MSDYFHYKASIDLELIQILVLSYYFRNKTVSQVLFYSMLGLFHF